MSLNTLPVAEKALQESVDGIVTCVSKPTRLAGSNTDSTKPMSGVPRPWANSNDSPTLTWPPATMLSTWLYSESRTI